MLIKGLNECDFVNYKKTSMFIIFPYCDFKCDREAGCSICQNSPLAHEPNIEMPIEDIVNRYLNNPITNAIVFGGLEPFSSPGILYDLIKEFRKNTDDDIVIYTGFKECELNLPAYQVWINNIKEFPNIIIKYGRFIPNQEPRYDEVLGVKLASDNQYARRIS